MRSSLNVLAPSPYVGSEVETIPSLPEGSSRRDSARTHFFSEQSARLDIDEPDCSDRAVKVFCIPPSGTRFACALSKLDTSNQNGCEREGDFDSTRLVNSSA